jgi:hypothetical protein
MSALPLEKVPYDPYVADIIEAYFTAGEIDTASEMAKAMADHYYSRLDYYLAQNDYIVKSAEYEIQTAIQYTSKVAGACIGFGKKELGEQINDRLEKYYTEYMAVVQKGQK